MRLSSIWRTIPDWWSFHTRTIEGRFDRTPETPADLAIRLEGERISRADAYAPSEPLGLAFRRGSWFRRRSAPFRRRFQLIHTWL